MTLGEIWKQKLDEISEKEAIFEFLESNVKEAIEQKKKYLWIPYGVCCYKGIIIDDSYEEILNEFAEMNDLAIKRTYYKDWIIAPK